MDLQKIVCTLLKLIWCKYSSELVKSNSIFARNHKILNICKMKEKVRWRLNNNFANISIIKSALDNEYWNIRWLMHWLLETQPKRYLSLRVWNFKIKCIWYLNNLTKHIHHKNNLLLYKSYKFHEFSSIKVSTSNDVGCWGI